MPFRIDIWNWTRFFTNVYEFGGSVFLHGRILDVRHVSAAIQQTWNQLVPNTYGNRLQILEVLCAYSINDYNNNINESIVTICFININIVIVYRMLPAYGIMMLLTAFVVPHLGDGPFWASRIWPEADKCKQHWWTNLILVSNFIKVENQVKTFFEINCLYLNYCDMLCICN